MCIYYKKAAADNLLQLNVQDRLVAEESGPIAYFIFPLYLE